jgi:hypothetical protein
MASFKIQFSLVDSKDGQKQSRSKKKQQFLLRVMESIYIQYPVMENKGLQVIIILRPTPNIQSFPIIVSTSLIPSSVYSIRNYHTTATPLSSSSSTNPAGHSWHQPWEIIGYLRVNNFLHRTHDIMSKMSCETKEDITVVIRNICHYKKLQKILCI